MLTICTILLGLVVQATPPAPPPAPPAGLLDCHFKGNTYVCRGRP